MSTTPTTPPSPQRHRIHLPLVKVFLALFGCNQPPIVESAFILPPEPTTLDDLRATADVGDPNGDPVQLRFTWSVNGEVQPDLTGAVVPAARTTRDEVWSVAIRAADAREEVDPVSADVIIRNLPPSIDVRLFPSSPGTDDTLHADALGNDPDGDTIRVAWSWQRNGALVDATTPDISPDLTVRGDIWTVTAEPSDDEARGQTSTASINIVNAVPRITALVLSPQDPDVTAPIAASAQAFDGDGEPVTLRWAWTVNGAPADADGPVLSPPAFVRGDIIVATVTGDDGMDVGPSRSSTPLTVGNALPSFTEATITAPIVESTVVECLGLGWSDPDGDVAGWSRAWTLNGQPLAATTPTLDGASFRRGDRLSCTLSPFDGFGTGEAIGSAEVLVGNSPPTLGGATITPDPAVVTSTLAILPGPREDADGDDVSLLIHWTVDGELIATTSTLPPGSFARGQEVAAIVTPSDGLDVGAPAATPPVVITNSPPQVLSVALSPDPPYGAVDLQAIAQTDDADDDAVTLSWTWTLDGMVLPVTGPTLPAGTFADGAVIGVSATPFDGFDLGPTFVGPERVATNSPPAILRTLLVPDEIYETTLVTCTPELAPDPDGDVVAVLIQWSVNGIDAGSSPTLDGSSFNRDDRVRCIAIPSDGTATGDPSLSAEVPVRDTAPELSTIKLTPTLPSRSQPPQIELGPAYDPDPDDVVTLSWAWSVNGVLVSTAPTLRPDQFARGDQVRVQVTPTDGTLAGSPLTAGPKTIVNSRPDIADSALSPAEPTTESTITATATFTDLDGDVVLPDWLFFVDGILVQSGDSPVLGPSFFQRGQSVYVWVEATDGIDAAAPDNSLTVVIHNTPPGPPGIDVAPRYPSPGRDDLSCLVLTTSEDADGDVITYEVVWTVDDQPYPRPADLGPTSVAWANDTVPAADLHPGETWTCTVIPSDLSDEGTPITGSATVIDPLLSGLSAGGDFTCAVDAAGGLRCWGHNDAGEAEPPPLSARKVVAGLFAACATDTFGFATCWGGSSSVSAVPLGLYSDIDIGISHACAVKTTGQLACWGHAIPEALLPPEGSRWVQVATGVEHGCARDEAGQVSCWGPDPTLITPPPGRWRDVAAGPNFTCAVGLSGALSCWGLGPVVDNAPSGPFRDVEAGILHACAITTDDTITCWGDGEVVDLDAPSGVWATVSPGASHTCAQSSTGQLHCWGSNEYGQGAPPDRHLKAIAPGVRHTCSLLTDGSPWCWGQDEAGSTMPPEPGQPAVDIGSGGSFSCAVLQDATLTCWGQDDIGQSAAPAVTDVHQLSVGGSHACALHGVDELSCWGLDDDGQATPPTSGPWTAVAAGSYHTCALDDRGMVSCWGLDVIGETSPPGGVFDAISAGRFTSCGLRPGGTMECWGDNGWGLHSTPTGGGWAEVALGERHACARSAAGTLSCWGDDDHGRTAPPDGAFVSLRAGADHTCGITVDGLSRCWGLYAH